MSIMARRKVDAAKLYGHLPKHYRIKLMVTCSWLEICLRIRQVMGDIESKGVTYIVNVEMWSCNCENGKLVASYVGMQSNAWIWTEETPLQRLCILHLPLLLRSVRTPL